MLANTERTLEEHFALNDEGISVWTYLCSCGEDPRECGHWEVSKDCD